MRRLFFIVNPISGSGRGKTTFAEAVRLLDAANADYGFAYTEYKGHALTLTRDALLRGEMNIVAVGGDGTVQEVASCVCGSDALLGILPCGTGNDFVKSLDIPAELPRIIDMLLSGEARRVDAAMANDKFFVNVAGFGFDVDVVRYTEKYKKRLNGMLPYMLGILQSVLHLRSIDVSIAPDDGEPFTTSAALLSVCNGTHFAGGIHLAPKASSSDGLLDVCIVHGMGRAAFLNLLPKYVKGKHLSSKHISYFSVKSLRAEICGGGEQELNLDGELGSSTPTVFKVLPGALKVISQ